MHKFYTLEDLTQEELNKLSLERNTLDSNWNELKKWLETMLDSPKDFYSVIRVKDTLDKMQELDGNNE